MTDSREPVSSCVVDQTFLARRLGSVGWLIPFGRRESPARRPNPLLDAVVVSAYPHVGVLPFRVDHARPLTVQRPARRAEKLSSDSVRLPKYHFVFDLHGISGELGWYKSNVSLSDNEV